MDFLAWWFNNHWILSSLLMPSWAFLWNYYYSNTGLWVFNFITLFFCASHQVNKH